VVWLVGAGVLVALAVAVAVVVRGWGPGSGDEAAGGAGHRAVDAAPGGGSADRPAPGPAADGGRQRPKRLASAEAREQLRRAIEAARRRREQREAEAAASRGGPSTPAAGGDAGPRGHLSKEYIRETVREVVPLIRECYEMALEDDDQYEGVIRAHFTISGEPEVAGLVETAELLAGGPDAGPDAAVPGESLSECLRETVLSLEFPAPEGGGEVTVTYPLRFSRGDDAGRAPGGS
jgi:hypothetical protein